MIAETNFLDSIGGSQCAAALGLNPYTQPITLYQEYVGEIPSFEGNESTEWGKAVEPLIRARYAREHHCDVVVPLSAKVIDDEWARVSPDGIAHNDNGTVIGFEAKQAGVRVAHRWGTPGTDDIPIEYMCQAQWYMWGTGLERWDVAVLIGGNEYQEYTVLRDDELIEQLVEGCRSFWFDNVLAKVPPPLDDSIGYRDFLIRRYPAAMSSFKQASDDAEKLVASLRKMKRWHRDTERMIQGVENQLRLEIGDAAGLYTELGKITCSARKGGTSWKTVALQLAKKYGASPRDVEELLEATRGAGSRPLTTQQNWNR
jgi:putative phage-type endonuclease